MPAFPAHPVICIGAIHSDTIAHASRVIRRETSTPASLAGKPGGVATNVARALVRLGIDTTLGGALGDDGTGSALTRDLTREGLHLCCVSRPGHVTGQYLALHDPDGSLAAACVDDRVLAEAPADVFDGIWSDLEAAATEKTTGEAIWFIDANLPDGLLGQVTARIAARAPGNLLVANAVSEAKAIRLKAHLGRIDCLMLNRGEAAALTGLDESAPSGDLAAALTQTGLGGFVLTSGAADTLVWQSGTLERFRPGETGVVDVTGAGDALTAGTLAALARGHSLAQAVPFGMAAAALTLRSTGALADGLSWEAISKF